MTRITEQEKKDKRFSIIISVMIHSSLLALFIFLVAWRMPDPPPEEYGMELNLGFDEQGSGDLEQKADNPVQDTENDIPPESETDTEEVTEEAQPDSEPIEEVQEVEEVEPAEPTEKVVAPTETQPTESDVKVTEENKEEIEEGEKEDLKPVEEEKKPEPPKPKPVVNKRALLGSKKSDTDSRYPVSGNQGKTLDKRGNMGKPDGKKNTDGRVSGGADFGVSLSLDGWKWDRPPADKDDSQIDGIIKFEIKVDDRGDVLSVTKKPGTTISDNTVIAFYKRQVEKLIFIRTDTKNAASAISKGEITFVLKTK